MTLVHGFSWYEAAHTEVVLRGRRAETNVACATSGFVYDTDVNVLLSFRVLVCLLLIIHYAVY
jgi:hypothetical protein